MINFGDVKGCQGFLTIHQQQRQGEILRFVAWPNCSSQHHCIVLLRNITFLRLHHAGLQHSKYIGWPLHYPNVAIKEEP